MRKNRHSWTRKPWKYGGTYIPRQSTWNGPTSRPIPSYTPYNSPPRIKETVQDETLGFTPQQPGLPLSPPSPHDSPLRRPPMFSQPTSPIYTPILYKKDITPRLPSKLGYYDYLNLSPATKQDLYNHYYKYLYRNSPADIIDRYNAENQYGIRQRDISDYWNELMALPGEVYDEVHEAVNSPTFKQNLNDAIDLGSKLQNTATNIAKGQGSIEETISTVKDTGDFLSRLHPTAGQATKTAAEWAEAGHNTYKTLQKIANNPVVQQIFKKTRDVLDPPTTKQPGEDAGITVASLGLNKVFDALGAFDPPPEQPHPGPHLRPVAAAGAGLYTLRPTARWSSRAERRQRQERRRWGRW